jgi:hypothetical protein
MAERQRLEARLDDLAGALEWPPVPDLADGVRAGIARARRRRLRFALLAAALAIALLGGAAAAAASPALRGEIIQRVPALPHPTPSASAPPGGAGARLDLGRRYPSLPAAEEAAHFRALVPAALGPPDEVWYRPEPGVLTLLYRPRAGLPASTDPDVGALVMEARANVTRSSFAKLIDERTRVQPVTVNGGAGFWVTGAAHGFLFLGGGGDAAGQPDNFRLAGDVLIWNQADLVVRIESGLDEQAALGVAGTVR